MALKKKITKPNGIQLEYHRIAMLTVEVNQQITLLVRSYLSESGREYEKMYESGEISGSNVTLPYNEGEYYNIDYRDNFTIKDAYEALKEMGEFSGAVDA